MTAKKAETLATEAAAARSPERKLAAVVTLEAVASAGTLDDPELVASLAADVEGGRLSAELDDLAEEAKSSSRPRKRRGAKPGRSAAPTSRRSQAIRL